MSSFSRRIEGNRDEEAARLQILDQPLERDRTGEKPNEVDVSLVLPDSKQEVKLRLVADWGVGVGGGVWSAALLLCRQIASRETVFRAQMQGRRVLELGAGTGVLGLAAAHICHPKVTVLTDLESYLPLLRENVDRNRACSSDIQAVAYDWNSDPALGAPFDFILGGDLAYNPNLYRPLIRALSMNSDAHTVIYLGVTRSDTGIGFYKLLDTSGFDYYRIPDWELAGKSESGSSRNFGLLVIFRRPMYVLAT
mmetsp:Transcript_24928/g.56142  ORF Transcript_24928/g.56142 Transcript_24928/m.56142 type:complete len:252 (+) Transcript_24928:103-858(+)